jgi:hypothetical protein
VDCKKLHRIWDNCPRLRILARLSEHEKVPILVVRVDLFYMPVLFFFRPEVRVAKGALPLGKLRALPLFRHAAVFLEYQFIGYRKIN